jgi:uncharacterized protein YcnI
VGRVVRQAAKPTAGALLALLMLLALANPAMAHVEVSADKPQAGATDVTVTFTAEAESNSAGVSGLQIVLPAGISPAEVALVSGPPGWSLQPLPDGFQVTGPGLAVGQDVRLQVRLAQLPTTSDMLTFKTLQSYTDGRVDRWIDLPTSSVPNPDMPAPVLQISGAVATTSPGAATTAGPTIETQLETAKVAPRTTSHTGWWIGIGALVLLAGLIAWLLIRNRRNTAARR